MVRTRPWTPWLYISPAVLVLLVIFGYPLVRIFEFSFKRIRGTTGPFVGWDNYRFVVRNPIFQHAVEHNLLLLISVPIMVFLALIFSVLLYERIAGWRFFRTTLFLPYILAVTVVGITFGYMFTLNGVINEALRRIGLGVLALDWLGRPEYALWTLMGIIIWKELGFGIVLFLARLMSVKEELYDAAKIDGCGWWGLMRYITIPQLRTIIEFFAIVSMINMLSWVFNYVYVITKGGPGDATQVMELFIYNRVGGSWGGTVAPGLASAAAVMLLLGTLVLIFLLFKLRGSLEEEQV